MERVSVVITTYKAEQKKAIETINSVLLQKGVNIQIIVADDGSDNTNFNCYRSFFEKKQFSNYLLLASEKNHGTVRNLLRTTEFCEGNYIKLLSPGDYLYGEDSLREWIEYMKSVNIDLSIADAYYYHRNAEGDCIIVKETAFPQRPDVLNGIDEKKKLYYQLIYNDYWLGAATLMKKEIFSKYIEIVSSVR